jgi:hypothetical protein
MMVVVTYFENDLFGEKLNLNVFPQAIIVKGRIQLMDGELFY